ncbi:MAG: hypothetical protein K2X55_03070 [Burkholderiaceae bacterium]|nr:hypothetical protein [Burkholderiaceae bacterium]
MSEVVPAAEHNPYAALHATLDKMMDDTVRIPGTKAWILLCGYAIGETAEVCGFADAFVKEHGHGIILVCTEKHAALARMYAHRFLKVVLASDDLMRAMLRSNYIDHNRFEPDYPLSACWIDRGFGQSDGIKYMWRYPERGGISETDMMRFVLRLPWNAKMDPPVISDEAQERAWQLGREAGIRLGRSVLLCPINNSAKKFPTVFWVAVADRLKELGYTVLTNMGGWKPHNGLDTMPIPGTIPVDLPIDTVIPFIHLCGRVITGTNGMSFLIMLGGLKTFKMTQLLPTSKEVSNEHSSLGFRAPTYQDGSAMIASYHYMSPELVLDSPLNEFMIAYDESPEELQRLGRVVAEQDTSDKASFMRLAGNGQPFIEAHAKWLRDMV